MKKLDKLENIVELIHIETGKSHLNIVVDVLNYIDMKKQEHPQRCDINIAREYVCEVIKYGNKHNQ